LAGNPIFCFGRLAKRFLFTISGKENRLKPSLLSLPGGGGVWALFRSITGNKAIIEACINQLYTIQNHTYLSRKVLIKDSDLSYIPGRGKTESCLSILTSLEVALPGGAPWPVSPRGHGQAITQSFSGWGACSIVAEGGTAAQCDRYVPGIFRFCAGIRFYSKIVLRKSNIFPSIKSRIANAPIIFFGVDRATNSIMNITAKTAKDTRSALRKGIRMCFARP